MTISKTMNLNALADLMGRHATREDAEMMRDLLTGTEGLVGTSVQDLTVQDTSTVDPALWDRLLDIAIFVEG